ncbi:MAG: hypothetical protein ACFWTZ_04775 [Burkholderia sp.]|jgi:tol-pal system protein YbgF
MKFRTLAAQLAIGSVLAAVSLQAAAFADDEARKAILELRSQVKVLQEQMRTTQDTLMSRLDALQRQNNALTGRVEELSNSLAVEKKSNRDLYGSLDERLEKFEPTQEVVGGQTVTVQPEEKQAYADAMDALKANDYKKAEAGFRSFTQKWKNSAYRADALYWRGSSLFALEKYQSAISVQNQLIREYPKSDKVPDAMLSVASSQAALGNINAAQATLNRVIKQYPKSDAARTAKERLKAFQ